MFKTSNLSLAVWALAALLVWPGAAAIASEAPAGAKLYIISPEPGQTVKSPVTVRFGLEGMGVAPAGVDAKNTGHHHLLIDVKGLPDLSRPLPSDAHHRHFGGGQTQAEIELEPGRHELRLLLGDHNHIPHDPPVLSEPVIIHVEE